MKQYLILGLLAPIGLLTGCTKDNYAPPSSQLTGRVVYNGEAVGVRGGDKVQLELWQRGYAQFNKIPVYIAQDGTFSATLFDGDYKLTRLRDNGPWQNNTDSLNVHVSGNTVVDLPVQPYFTLSNATFTKGSSGTVRTVTTSVKVNKIGTKDLESVTLYLGYTQFVDQTNQTAQANMFVVTDFSKPVSLTANVPAGASNFVYARVAVKTTGVTERVYTPVQKVDL